MKNDYKYILFQINRKNGEIKMVDEKKIMKEINKVYKDLKIEKRTDSINRNNNLFIKNIGFYDNNKKSYLDNKTSVKTRYNYYGGME